jgi:hypothetical protein
MKARSIKLAVPFIAILVCAFCALSGAGAQVLKPQSVEFGMINDFPLGSYQELSSYNVGWQSRLNLDYTPAPRFGAFLELGNAYWTGSPAYIGSGTQISLTAGARVHVPVSPLGNWGSLKLGGDLGYGLLSHLSSGEWTDNKVKSFFDQALILDGEISISLARLPLDPFLNMRYLFSPGETNSTHEFGLHIGLRYRINDAALARPKPAPRPSPEEILASVLPAFAPGDAQDSVTADICLVGTADGLPLIWASEDPGLVAADGSVTRPAFGEGDRTTRLRASFSRAGTTASRDYVLTVKERPQTKAEAVSAAIAGISLELPAAQSGEALPESLSLATEESGGVRIEWFSSRPDLVSSEGAITRPPFGAGDTEVVLTAVVFKGGTSETRKMTVLVRELPQTDAEAVLADCEDLRAGLLPGMMPYALRYSIDLPHAGKRGSAISWDSSRPEILSAAGSLQRPQGDSAFVTLVATVSKGDSSRTARFLFEVEAAPEASEATK